MTSVPVCLQLVEHSGIGPDTGSFQGQAVDDRDVPLVEQPPDRDKVTR